MIRVAATASHDIDRGAGVAPVFSGEVRSLNFDFLDKIDADIVDLTIVAARVHVEAAIDRETVIVGPIAVHCCLADAQAGSECQLILVEDHGAGDQGNQLHIVAPVQRQILHLPLVNHPRYFAGRRIHSLADAGTNLHCLG